jgi:signal transduction histidine kinase
MPFITHVTDIVIASVLQYLTLGPSSPFFTYFIYALFSAALRWGWQATVRTAAFVLFMYIATGLSISRTIGPADFELDRFIVRLMYLVVVTVALVYLGRHEARLRDEIRQLANWPMASGGDWASGVPKILEHAAGIVGAGRVTCVWSVDEEPWSWVATWPGAAPIVKHPPGAIDPPVSPSIGDSTFVCAGPVVGEPTFIVSRAGALLPRRGEPVHARLLPYVQGADLASAAFKSEDVSGRVFFTGVPTVTSEIIPLAEVLAREIGASFGRLYSDERSRQFAIAEDRIRVARNLHDGVLQSLTGVRLELQSMAGLERTAASPPPVGDRLLAIERALALEQRELRSFIEDLKPGTTLVPADGSLAARLDDLRRRLALEWRTSITIRVSPEHLSVPEPHDRAVVPMVHEAIVNALKHGRPTRVSADLQVENGILTITVTDDGCGFPFAGRRDRAALVAANAGPVSLRERAESLGGEIVVESSAAGARVELSLPLGAGHA